MNITISAFFSGTAHKISDQTYLAGFLYKNIDTDETQKTMGFDGCGITDGISGMLFGSGLDRQANELIELVKAEIQKNNKVTLNIFGHSRGAIAALLTAKQLGHVDPRLLEINLALHDPVPGNFIITSTIDVFDISLAKKTMDLRDCKPLKRVLALYPHEPLPAIVAHAPLFSLYPVHAEVEEEVMPGCHSGAAEGVTTSKCRSLRVFDDGISQPSRGRGDSYPVHTFLSLESFITFARVFRFLQDCGSRFKSLPYINVPDIKTPVIVHTVEAVPNARDILHNILHNLVKPERDALDAAVCAVYAQSRSKASDRSCHSATGVHIHTKPEAPYFNLHHQRLVGAPRDKKNVLASLEKNNGLISKIKRAIMQHPKKWNALKWTLLILSVSALLFFTGGFAAIPIVAGVAANLGPLSIIAMAPLVGITLAASWYGILKHVSEWSINRFFYPQFYMRHIQPTIEKSASTSHHQLIAGLGVKESSETIAHSNQPSVSSLWSAPVDNTNVVAVPPQPDRPVGAP